MSDLLTDLKVRMDAFFRATEIENGVRVNTHCLYPSNSVVQVYVMGSGSSYFVSDGGGAFKEAEAAGAAIPHPDRMFSKLLKKQGLSIKNGAIFSPSITVDSLPAAVAVVANTSKEMADTIFETWRLSKARNFKEEVRKILRAHFPEREIKEEKVSGTSNKSHTFENVIHFLNGTVLLVDPVLKDANSINSRFVANLDVSQKKYPNLKQRIIYDDQEDWQGADLNLLAVSGASVIPYSKSEEVIVADLI